jgi:hypothetical protein
MVLFLIRCALLDKYLLTRTLAFLCIDVSSNREKHTRLYYLYLTMYFVIVSIVTAVIVATALQIISTFLSLIINGLLSCRNGARFGSGDHLFFGPSCSKR